MVPCEPAGEGKAKELPEWSEKVAQNILSGIPVMLTFPHNVNPLEPMRRYLDNILYLVLNNLFINT